MDDNEVQKNSTDGVNRAIRDAYEGGHIYKVENICNQLNRRSTEYADLLLAVRLQMVRYHAVDGTLVDLCCATGEHLFGLADLSGQCVGIDFSRPFIEKAIERAGALGLSHVQFEVGDARAIPLQTASVSTLYSFSSLYAIPDIDVVVKEIARVLRTGGKCIIDYGNSRSLNAICVRAYAELPPTFHLRIDEMESYCESNGLKIVERRAFQLLPLWADKPRWLWPLLLPFWKRIMAKQIGGKMLDEWLSSSLLFRRFAFRHVLVCEKCPAKTVQ
jgi:SAM-dependent methyltransferase